MLLDDVATYLAANSTALSVGGTTGSLSKAQMLDTQPDTLVALFETGGLASVFTFSTTTGSVTRQYEQPGLQVLSRSTSYQTARNNAETVHTLLDGLNDTKLPTSTGVRYLEIVANQAPFYTGPDGNGRFIISTNYAVKKETG